MRRNIRIKKIFIRLFVCVMIISLMYGEIGISVSAVILKPKNIIIMIGDGMGYNHSLAASYYGYGGPEMQIYHEFPYKYAHSTYSANGTGYDPAMAWSDFDYVTTNYTDSAAAATAMATGVKTYNTRIGIDINGNPLDNVFEAAEACGKSTGIVTSVVISHATAAGFVAHNISRDNFEEIANEMVYTSLTDVILGAGHPFFNNNGQLRSTPDTYRYVGGQPTWDALVAGSVSSDVDNDGIPEPTTLIQSLSEFQSMMTGPTPERVIGVAQVATTLQQKRSGDGMADPYVVPFNANVPTLSEMSLAAINILDNDPNGFVLMIEGGAVDSAAHDNQPGRLIEEQISFDQAVEDVVDWVETNSSWMETVVIVTGDHETGYLWGPGSNPTWQPLINYGMGVLPGMQFNYTYHTNSLIAIYARGEGAAIFETMVVGVDPVRGNYVDNTSIARVIFELIKCDKVFLPSIQLIGD